jgi:hypothetical protein
VQTQTENSIYNAALKKLEHFEFKTRKLHTKFTISELYVKYIDATVIAAELGVSDLLKSVLCMAEQFYHGVAYPLVYSCAHCLRHVLLDPQNMMQHPTKVCEVITTGRGEFVRSCYEHDLMFYSPEAFEDHMAQH